MENLLEEFYNADLIIEKFHPRKFFIDEKNYHIWGITQTGKTKLLKSYLLSLTKGRYLYINCKDLRIDYNALNSSLATFCKENKIEVLALDNYHPTIKLFPMKQILLSSEYPYTVAEMIRIHLYPLDYEEFLAYEHKYDSSALNHFFKLGSFPAMHKVNSDERVFYVQKMLQLSLTQIELDILSYCAKFFAQKISAYMLYQRLKSIRKISKDKLYSSFEDLSLKRYIHLVEKIDHPKATKKVYLCDISLKVALSTEKNFAKLFENMIFLELLKAKHTLYYEENVEFYLPSLSEVILSTPFTDERTLFKKIQAIEAFIIHYQIKKITAVTMNKEVNIAHPFSKVEMVPFDIWALRD